MASEAELIQAAREYREARKAHAAAVTALVVAEAAYNNAHAAVTSADEAWQAASAKLRDIASHEPAAGDPILGIEGVPVKRGREFI